MLYYTSQPGRPKILLYLDIIELLGSCGYTWSQVADAMHISRTTLWRCVKDSWNVQTHHLQDDTQPPADENANRSEDEFGLHRVDTFSADPIIVSLSLKGQKLDMEVDTGAAFSVRHATKLETKLYTHLTWYTKHTTYTVECMKVEGTLNVTVKYGNQTKKPMLVVVKWTKSLSRNWLKHIQLDWHNIFTIRTVELKPLNSLLQQHKTLFSKELGKIQTFTASRHIKPDATP